MHGQLQQLRDAFAEAPDLAGLLENPEVESTVKADVLTRVAQGSDQLVVNFLRLLAEKGRAAELADVAEELDALVAAEQRILDVELTTATELSDDEFGRILGRIENRLRPQGAGGAEGRPGPDRRHRPPGRLDEARRERARPPRTTSPRPSPRKELETDMKLRPEEITSILRERIEKFDVETDLAEVGAVLQVGDGIARVHGLENCLALEMLELEHGVTGLAFNLEEDNVGVALFGDWEQGQGRRARPAHRQGRLRARRRGPPRPRRRPARQPARRARPDRVERDAPRRVEGAGRDRSASP